MLVWQAKDRVRQWVLEQASHLPGFRGAFFHGSINWLADEDSLPATSDVDVIVVLQTPFEQTKPGKLLFQDVILDASFLPADQICSADQVLGLSHLAGSLRVDSIISDTDGRLREIQQAVSRDFARREWVLRRCEHARQKVRSHLQALDESRPFQDQATAWLFGTGVTTHILLAAGLQNPTVRKRYLVVRELLAKHGRSDFYSLLLDLLGSAHLSQAQAAAYLGNLEGAFDAACALIRSPFPFASDIHDLARPVTIAGSREMIANGDQREAAFWLAVTYSRCMQVLVLDGSPSLFARHEPGYRALLADLGIFSFSDLRQRSQKVLDSLPQIWKVAEEIIK